MTDDVLAEWAKHARLGPGGGDAYLLACRVAILVDEVRSLRRENDVAAATAYAQAESDIAAHLRAYATTWEEGECSAAAMRIEHGVHRRT